MPRYIFPPRPTSKIKPEQLDSMESQGVFIWQPKFDGDRCIPVVDGNKADLGNRHHKWHPAGKFSQIRDELLRLKLPSGTHYLDGELVRHNGKDALVLFDALQITDYLIGVDQLTRLAMLFNVCGQPSEPHPDFPDAALKVSDSIWLSTHGDSEFSAHFRSFVKLPLIEGLLLRKKDSTLDNWGASPYEVDWQVRCRRPHKNYRF